MSPAIVLVLLPVVLFVAAIAAWLWGEHRARTVATASSANATERQAQLATLDEKVRGLTDHLREQQQSHERTLVDTKASHVAVVGELKVTHVAAVAELKTGVMTSAEMATSRNKLKNSLLEKLSAQQSVIELLKEHETPASRSLPTSRLNPVAR